MKPCPFCAEEIKEAAVKCKHCGSMLGAASPLLRPEVQPAVSAGTPRCPSCGNAIAPDAASCSRCGVQLRPAHVVTERTSKQLKLQHLFACLAFVFGFAVVTIDCGVSASEGSEMSPASIVLFVVGLAFYVVSRVRIWWHHH